MKSYIIIYRNGKKKKYQSGEGISYDVCTTGNFLILQTYNHENKEEGNVFIPISIIKEVKEIIE